MTDVADSAPRTHRRFWPSFAALTDRALDAAHAAAGLLAAGWHRWRGCAFETRLVLIFVATLSVLSLWPAPDLPDTPTGALRGTGDQPSQIELPYDRSPWQSLPQRLTAVTLDAPDMGGAPHVRVSELDSGPRHDLLHWPATDRRIVSGAISVERDISPADPAADTLYVDAARRMALAGASIVRMAQSAAAESKFGALETADVAVFTEGRQKHCIAFRTLAPAPARIAGWLCGTAERPMGRVRLACLIDRIDIAAGDDADLRAWLAQVEQGRQLCSGKSAPALTRSLATSAVGLKPALNHARKAGER